MIMVEMVASITAPEYEKQGERTGFDQIRTSDPSLRHFNNAWIRHLDLASAEIALRSWIVDN